MMLNVQLSKRVLVAVVFTITVLCIVAASKHQRGASNYLHRLVTTHELPTNCSTPLRPQVAFHSKTTNEPIPNIVHYTQLKKNEDSRLDFSFRDFLSLYASTLYIRPTTIFLHTDHNDSTVKEAATSGTKWTRKLPKDFPTVRINHVVPQPSANGRAVHVEARSDFVRQEMLWEYGGLSMDWDVLPLRDIGRLRSTGCDAIVGRQHGGKINTGVVIARRHSALTYLMRCNAPRVFDGGWETHSMQLLTHIAEHLTRISGQVLVLDEKSFAPTNWEAGSIRQLFETHAEAATWAGGVEEQDTRDLVAEWYNQTARKDWEIDFSPTYLLHAFHRRDSNIPDFRGVNELKVTNLPSLISVCCRHTSLVMPSIAGPACSRETISSLSSFLDSLNIHHFSTSLIFNSTWRTSWTGRAITQSLPIQSSSMPLTMAS